MRVPTARGHRALADARGGRPRARGRTARPVRDASSPRNASEPIAQPSQSDRNFYDRYWFNGYDRDGALNPMGGAVTGFTKSLEQEGGSVSQRVRSEYQRVRDKLSQALRG